MNHVATSSFLLIRRLLRPFNLDIRRTGQSLDWLARAQDPDPITYLYFADLRHVPPVATSIADARFGVTAFPFDRASGNPLVLAFQGLVADDTPAARAAARAVLSEYYATVRPRSAHEILDLTADEAPGLCDVPAHLWIAPWGTETVEQRAWRVRMWSAKDGIANMSILSAKDGLTAFGPATGKKVALEVTRIANLANSIRRDGFRIDTRHMPEVFGLRAGDEYRWFVIRGQHRFAACAAFGIERVKSRLIKIVRREDAAAWPHVVSKTFTLAGALKVFDRLFLGRAPSCAAAWVECKATGRPTARHEII